MLGCPREGVVAVVGYCDQCRLPFHAYLARELDERRAMVPVRALAAPAPAYSDVSPLVDKDKQLSSQHSCDGKAVVGQCYWFPPRLFPSMSIWDVALPCLMDMGVTFC